jgi:ABC-type nickel/cobalt efflux system permease component RcnA
MLQSPATSNYIGSCSNSTISAKLRSGLSSSNENSNESCMNLKSVTLIFAVRLWKLEREIADNIASIHVDQRYHAINHVNALHQPREASAAFYICESSDSSPNVF